MRKSQYSTSPRDERVGGEGGSGSCFNKNRSLGGLARKDQNQHALGTKPLLPPHPSSLPRSHNNTQNTTHTHPSSTILLLLPFFSSTTTSFPLHQFFSPLFGDCFHTLITSRSLCPARFSCFRLRRSSYRVFSRRYHSRPAKTRIQRQDSIIGLTTSLASRLTVQSVVCTSFRPFQVRVVHQASDLCFLTYLILGP